MQDEKPQNGSAQSEAVTRNSPDAPTSEGDSEANPYAGYSYGRRTPGTGQERPCTIGTRLKRSTKEAVRAAADRYGVPMAEVVRRAIRNELETV